MDLEKVLQEQRVLVRKIQELLRLGLTPRDAVAAGMAAENDLTAEDFQFMYCTALVNWAAERNQHAAGMS